jgi:DNA primase
MALPAAFLDELRARTPLPGVIGLRVRLARSGRQWKGCCPFHGEKTPSFYVYDDHYHCFGCGAHGDAIGFVMQSQGAGFMEAVEQLAAEAGLEVPKPSPEAAEADRRRHDLASVLAEAQASFQRRLFLPEGREALDYLRGRGLTDATIRDFCLGWSGEGRGALTAELQSEGIGQDLLIEAGLLREAEPGGSARELFFHRVMFPIQDRRGRVISFGGRTLGDGQPKYLNGPETPLFSKRRTLYGLDRAREAARRRAPLVLVEGYMDVIALHQAGVRGAVAPLGTALTEEQFEELWRLTPAPILCFDGDAAGARAAFRAAELALPLLSPERTLALATLPNGQDPDTLVRRDGVGALQSVLDAARPLSEALYDLLREAGDATPEQRAAFRARLEAASQRIPDRALAAEYRRTLLDRYFNERRRAERPGGSRGGQRTDGKGGKTPRHRPPPRPHPNSDTVAQERGRILTAILLRHPALLPDVEDAFSRLPLPPLLRRLREALHNWADDADVLDSPTLIAHLTTSGFESEIEHVLAPAPVPLPACATLAVMPAEAEAGWWHIFGFLNVERLREEVGQAGVAFTLDPTPQTQRRLIALTTALDKVASGEPDGIDRAA